MPDIDSVITSIEHMIQGLTSVRTDLNGPDYASRILTLTKALERCYGIKKTWEPDKEDDQTCAPHSLSEGLKGLSMKDRG